MPVDSLTLDAVLEFVSRHDGETLHTLQELQPFQIGISDAGGVRFDRPNGSYETVKPSQLRECVEVFNRLTPDERQHSSNFPKEIWTTSYIASLFQAIFVGEVPSVRPRLQPKRKPRIVDLLSEVGIDVSDWEQFKGKNPATNPKYCYDWAFSSGGQLVLCLWHIAMKEKKGSVFQDLDYRTLAASSRGPRKKRAEAMDHALQEAARGKRLIRVIVVDGVRQGDNGAVKSKVTRRLLDPVPWAVASYNWSTGACRLIRGGAPVQFADQFSAESDGSPQKRMVEAEAFVRNPAVRRSVLRRANGNCESCGKPGFLMDDDRIYLETHHIVPLSEGGPDNERNVIALCPNEHREAHSGSRRRALQEAFGELVKRKIESAGSPSSI